MVAAVDKRQILAAMLIIFRRRRRRRQLQMAYTRCPPAFWVRDIFLKREQLGEFHTLVQEMRNGDRESFFR